ncbi:hypothetical protein ABZ016_22335 [Streptomyces sp. NPDC006372]|uniref:hypothetical protein n=1 Tax=Streptomyces sp. NPDC006372 TaxID=3155599 RepID=UPI0033BE093D
MIPRLHERTHRPHHPLEEALGRPVSPNEGLKEHTIAAHWPGLDYFTLDDEQKTWTSVQWAEHLEDPYWSTRSPPAPTTTGGRSSTSTSAFTPTTGN